MEVVPNMNTRDFELFIEKYPSAKTIYSDYVNSGVDKRTSQSLVVSNYVSNNKLMHDEYKAVASILNR